MLKLRRLTVGVFKNGSNMAAVNERTTVWAGLPAERDIRHSPRETDPRLTAVTSGPEHRVDVSSARAMEEKVARSSSPRRVAALSFPKVTERKPVRDDGLET